MLNPKETYRKHLREVAECEFGDADCGLWHVVRNNGGTKQLSIAYWREMYVENNAVVDGQSHQLQKPRQG